ncbi:MAG TPA: glycosyltransferase [Myxococcales bacterium]|nr:glycosyltransferase [Myxococcales bacterium]
MARILFSVLAEKGHLHPFIGPAQELQARGHEVAFYAPCDVTSPLGRAGLTRFLGDAAAAPPPDRNRGPAFAALVRDPPRLRRWIRELLLDTIPAEVDRLGASIARWRPDVIAADPMAYAVPIVSARAGVPWIGLSTSLNPVVPEDWDSELAETLRALRREDVLAREGVAARFRVADCLAERGTVVYSTPELVGAPPPGIVLAGASLPRGPRGDRGQGAEAGELPLVYMSLGSQIYHQPRMFEVVLGALAELPVRGLLALGDLDGAFPLPARVRSVPYAAQLDVLREAAVFVTHGGANSLMEGLAFGVPLLVSPICNDQFHNARFVQRAGAGVVLDLDRARPREVRDCLERLLANGLERRAARRIGASYRKAGGAALAADVVLAAR